MAQLMENVEESIEKKPFQSLELMKEFIQKEFTEQRVKERFLDNMKILKQVEVTINKPTTNCKV